MSLLISFFFLIFVYTDPLFFPMYWTTIPNVLVWVAVGIAGIVFPYRAKDIFRSSPITYKVGGVYLISIIATISLLPQLIFAYVLCFDPFWAWGDALSPEAFLLTGCTVVLGFAIYFIMKYYRKRKGIDITLAYKELPPL